MAVRTDEVQLRIDFITDEGRQLAKTLLTTKEYNREIAASTSRIAEYQKQLLKVGSDEAKRAPILAKIAAEEKKVADNLGKVAAEGKKVESLNLERVAPAQLVERSKQLAAAIRLIPQSAPEFKALQTELAAVNARIRDINVAGKGAAGQSGGGFGLGSLAGFAAKASIAVGAVVGTVRTFFSALSGSGKLEQLNIAFETFLGNAELAKKVVADLRKFADVTPFETEQVNQAGRALLAFGFTADELIPTLTRVGDVASGTGKDFNELALIYGKAKTQGLIQGEELNQLAEAGIPIYAELAKVLGVNEKEIRKLGEQGKISFASLEQVFKNLTGEGGRFAGLMERQSKSLDGLFSTLASAIQGKLTAAMNDLLPLIKSITKGFIDFLTVPVSETLEKERQGFNGVALSILTAKEGTEQRTKAIKSLQEQYPAFLGNIDAEKITNAQLKPILDQINQSYVVRIALQKQQEKLQPLLEAQAEQENRLAEGRAASNRLLARGAELAGVNLLQFQTDAERTQAVIEALNKTAQFRSAGGFDQPLNEQARVLAEIKANLSGIDATTVRTRFATQQATDAERQRQEVVAELRKTYGEVFAILDAENAKSAAGETNADAAGVAAAKAAAAAKKLKETINLELQQVDIQFAKEEITALKLKQDGILADETKFGNVMVILEEQQLQARLDVYRRYGQDQTKEALEIQKKLLEIQQQRSAPAIAPLDTLPAAAPGQVQSQGTGALDALAQASANGEISVIQDKFAIVVDLELQHELRIAEIRRNAAEERIRMLKEAGLSETAEFRRALDEKAAADADFQAKRIENERRTAELRKEVEQTSLNLTSDIFALGAELLSQDERARKKNGAAIKAFQSAQVITNGILEVQKIWATVASYPPPANAIIGGLLTGVAVARTGLAVGKIQAAKFAGGGYTGRGFGPADETGYKQAGIVHEGEYVVPKRVVEDRAMQPVIRVLEHRRLRGYADGGLVTVNTTPIALPSVQQSQQTVFAQVDALNAAVEKFGVVVDRFPKEVRSRVVLTELEDAQSSVDTVRSDAAL